MSLQDGRKAKVCKLSLADIHEQIHQPCIAVPFDLEQNPMVEWIVLKPKKEWMSSFQQEMKDHPWEMKCHKKNLKKRQSNSN